MSADPTTPPLAPGRQLRALLPLLLTISLALTTATALAGTNAALALSRFAIDGGVALLWATSAAGLGSLLLRLLRPPAAHPAFHLALAFGLGTGLLSLAQLALGLAGLLGFLPTAILLTPGLLAAALHLRTSTIPLSPIPRQRSRWLWLLFAPPLAAALFLTLVPAGYLWRGEPNGYDVVAYHLQLPREWLELGHIIPLRHNVFSYFPLAMEMHYLTAMQLMGGPWEGMYTAHLMHLLTFAAAALAAYGHVRTCLPTTRLPALTAALTLAATPYVLLLAPIAYNEGPLLLFGTLILALLFTPTPTRTTYLLAGLCAGFAAGAKLTALPLWLLTPALALLLYRPPISPDTRPPRRITGLALFALAALLALSPWLIRTALWTGGNPLFPLATNLLGRAHFTPEQIDRFTAAHAPRPDQQSLPARLTAFSSQVLTAPEFGYVLLPAAVLATLPVLRRRPLESPLPALLLLLLLHTAIWLFATHLQARFFVPTLPILALLLALSSPRLAPLLLAAPLTALITALLLIPPRLGHLRDPATGQLTTALLGLDYRSNQKFLLPEPITSLPPTTPLTLVGDARAFLYTHPTSHLKYTSVFDLTGPDLRAAYRAAPTDTPPAFLWIDPAELARFARTYRHIPPLPPPPPDWNRPAPFLLPP